jgi:2-dehydro-3-deoxyphosphogluconate aldolase/(4S)-4-hydroxy-2-oxoglutarate aldolase
MVVVYLFLQKTMEGKMARFKRLEVLNTIVDAGLVPIFYQGDLETAQNIVGALADGGLRAIEFTNRGDGAHRVFAELADFVQRERPEVILGVGSVVDAPTASLYINNGANFIVGPILNPEVALLCNRRKVAYAPGCATLSEISRAEELGVEICKLFPGAEIGGPAFVKNILGPCPWTSIMPTGGVNTTKENIDAWIHAGVVSIGIGSKIITSDLVAAKDFEGIRRNVEHALGLIREARASRK